MANATLSTHHQDNHDYEVWDSLKQAISNSSGFQQWQEGQLPEEEPESTTLDYRVRHYLRETLETLAY